MSKQHNIHNLATKYNSRLHISKFIEPIIKPLTKKTSGKTINHYPCTLSIGNLDGPEHSRGIGVRKV